MDDLLIPDGHEWNMFLPLTKVEKQADGSRLVFLEVNDETRDLEGEVVSHEAMKKAAADYMEWANIREMHGNLAVGNVLSLDINDELRKVTGIGRVVDPTAILKLDTGVYKGSSLGGLKGKARMGKSADGKPARIIDEIVWTELSLVDRPSRPTALLTLMKRAKEDTLDPKDAETVAAITAASPAALLQKDAPADAPAPEAATEPVVAPEPTPAPAVAPESPEAPPAELEKAAPTTGSLSTDDAIVGAAMAILAKGTVSPGIVSALHVMTAPAAVVEPLVKAAPGAAQTPPPESAPEVVLPVDALAASIMDRLSKSTVFATPESLEAMKAQVLEGLDSLKTDLAKVAAQPAPGGPARYAADARRTPEQGAQMVEAEILAKAAQATNDPMVREELGRLAAAAQIRAAQA